MTPCFFASDLHGHKDRYLKLFQAIRAEKPRAVFLGGDLLPNPMFSMTSPDKSLDDFINGFLVTEFNTLQTLLGPRYPRVFTILGNDDGRFEEASILDAATRGVWEYVHGRSVNFDRFKVYGYAFIPPTPFLLKDWERYDVSRYVDPGCISPENGWRSIPVSEKEMKDSTIKKDLELLTNNDTLENAVILFHSPPYNTKLDRAALDGRMIDYVPLDVHVGSIAIQRFIEARQPLLTLHGHVHESARLTGAWRGRIHRSHLFSAAHDGPELALVRMDLDRLSGATRELI
ncbi:MAG: metallophosphoesterase [Desulfobacteraceae bacterium]|jgi:Icc-related predicted phosphoesterase|nr:metallophosphoesterase [Desulfobacteraceae bacterium]